MRADIKERIEKINRGEVPEGYKKTKVGIIPKTWIVDKLNKYSKIIDGDRGKNYPSEKDCVDEGVLFLSTKNIVNNKFDFTEKRFITRNKFDLLGKGKLKQNDLVITMRGSIGNVVKFNSKDYETAFINAQMAIIRPTQISSSFLWMILNSQLIQNKIKNISSGSAQQQLTKKGIEVLEICVPPFNEQKKIASILSTWDNAIELKEKLIQNKKEQKKGLMQNLLTGKVRLNGFNDAWKKVKLGNIIKNNTEKTKVNNQYPILSCTKDGVVNQNEHFNKQIASKNNIGYKVLRKDQLVLSPMNLWLGGIDISDFKVGIVSPAYKVYEVDYKLIGKNYLRNLLRSEYMISKYDSISQKGASIVRKNLSIKDFEDLPIKIPSNKLEMDAIDELIELALKETMLLEKELESLQKQKKGLMNLLLTGKVRVEC